MVRRLSILTWNVWFDAFKMKERYAEILQMCETLKPDVVCLQEVTPEFLRSLQGHRILQDYANSGTKWGWSKYGVLTLCRRELQPTFAFSNLETEMDRNLLTTHINTGGGELCIGNVHLESLSNPELRKVQLKQSCSILRGCPLSVLCGDFNICAYGNYHQDDKPLENDEIARQLVGYRDLWADCHQQAGVDAGNAGFTFDTVRNAMLSGRHREERWRYDRIMYRTAVHAGDTSAPTWRPASVQIVGDLPVGQNVPHLLGLGAESASADPAVVEPAEVPAADAAFSTPVKSTRENGPVFPSDHFGLYGVLQYQ
jgi:tyrosyl-DNA phosphodiesterase 2